jgi:hypothetical protein
MSWKRDSHGLFDYESKETIENNWKLSNKLGLLTRSDKGTNLLEDKDVSLYSCLV